MDNSEKLATLMKKTKQKQYVLDTATRKQAQTTQMKYEPSYKNWRQRRNKHRFYVEITTYIKTWNLERKET
jgi:hypothetical protein